MIDLVNISVQFSGDPLFQDVNLRINPSDRIALVGSNGAGKTTLLKIINEDVQPETGKILKQKNISAGYLPQEIINTSGKPLFTEVRSSLQIINFLEVEEINLTDKLSDVSNDEERDIIVKKLGEVHHKQEEVGYYSINSEIEKILIGLGFKQKDFQKNTNEFSGGWQMRIELAKILLSNHNILLLDEPTNHLDLDSLEWLISYLKSFKGALLIISHDKHFVNSVTDKTLEIFLKKITFFNGNYNAYLEFKKERDEMLGAQYIQQQKKIKDTEKFIERFRYKATKARQVQSRIKQLEKIELIEIPDSESEINIRFPSPPQSGVVPMELKRIKKSYGDNVVFDGLDFKIDRGDKIAFVGPNGAGKTTLSKIISGKTEIDSGERIVGHNTIVSYYSQEVADNLDLSIDILQTLDEIAEDKTIGQLRTILGSFLFTGDDVFKKIEVLSGGEKSRVALAKILLTKANLIVLDEPTNHLDITSKAVLQRALIDFPGTLVIVSHDIDFLNPIVNKVVEIRTGSFKLFYGGTDYYMQKREEMAAAQNQNTISEQPITNRKESKRIEAEQRQQKYAATKDLIKQIESIEQELDKLEQQKKIFEQDLMDPSIYSNALLIKQTNSQYSEIKEKLNQNLSKWTVLSEKLEQIEKMFD